MRVITSAPAKAILLGEHSVNRGQSALAVSVGLRVRCTLETELKQFTFASGNQTQEATRTSLLQLAAQVDGWREAQHYEAIRQLARDDFFGPAKYIVAKAFGAALPSGLRVSWGSEIPSAGGLGSGGASFVALAKALSPFGRGLGEGSVGELAYPGDVIAHGGVASALDTQTSLLGGAIRYTKVGQFVGSAIRLDFRHKAVNEAITLDELKAADIREGDIVILWEGRDGQYRTQASHQRPYVAADAAEYLALEKRIKLLGTDSSGFEVRGRNDHPNHHLFFRDDVAIPVVECLRNLGAISTDRFFFVGLPLPVKGLDASPIRAIAIEGISL